MSFLNHVKNGNQCIKCTVRAHYLYRYYDDRDMCVHLTERSIFDALINHANILFNDICEQINAPF